MAHGTADNAGTIEALLRTYGSTFAEELGLSPERNTPADLFGMLVFAILSSTRIKHTLAVSGARALRDKGLTTAEKVASSTWRERTDILNNAGYARYDESTSQYLGETAQHLLDRYGGDLHALRDRAERDPARERDLIKECKGIGDVGTDIFFREAQASWDELFPLLDDRAREAAGRLGLPTDAADLARHTDGTLQHTRLIASLVRCELEDGYADITALAAS